MGAAKVGFHEYYAFGDSVLIHLPNCQCGEGGDLIYPLTLRERIVTRVRKVLELGTAKSVAQQYKKQQTTT